MASRHDSDPTLSYLLHPPFLDEVGLASAIRWFAKGFENRSGVTIRLSVPDNFPRLPQDIEIALFRVIQESLINIHRHAESSTAAISLGTADGELTLEIRDAGRACRTKRRRSVGSSTCSASDRWNAGAHGQWVEPGIDSTRTNDVPRVEVMRGTPNDPLRFWVSMITRRSRASVRCWRATGWRSR